MAMWVPEVERGHNGVSQLFRIPNVINLNDAICVSEQEPHTPQSCWSVDDLEGVLGFGVGITDVIQRIISHWRDATDGERAT